LTAHHRRISVLRMFAHAVFSTMALAALALAPADAAPNGAVGGSDACPGKKRVLPAPGHAQKEQDPARRRCYVFVPMAM